MKEILDSFFNLLDPQETLNESERSLIAETASIVRVKKHQVIQQIGQTCRTLYFIQKGGVKIFYMHNDLEVIDSFAFEGQLAIRFESLISGRPSKRGIRALESSVLLAFDMIKLEVIFKTNPTIEVLFHQLFHIGHLSLIERLESIQFHTAKQRYEDLLVHHPDILDRMPLKSIASYLGITPVSLSRLRANV